MPGWLLYTLGVLIFAFGLLFSIALHEIGHMVPAKKFGVKVTQYMVGFGPTLFSRKRGDTEYGVKAVPLGGYIRMIGMVPPRADGKRSRWPRRIGTAVEDFRALSRQEVVPEDEHRQFYRLTPGKKMIVMVGGPSMNLLIYIVLTIVLLVTIGKPESNLTSQVAAVEKCVVPATSDSAKQGTCKSTDAPTPAIASGLKPGDTFVSVDGTAITGWDQLTKIIQASAGKNLSVVVRHKDGSTGTLAITPTTNLNYVSGSTTKIAKVGFIGFEPATHNYFSTQGIGGIVGYMGGQIHLGLSTLGHYPAKVKNLYQVVFEGKKRDPQGAVGVIGISRISGDYAESSYLNAKDKFFTLVSLLATVNLLLFFFNLLPLLPLDGGHVAGAIVESIKRGRARLRARGRPAEIGPDGAVLRPGRHIFVDTAQMLPVMYAVASVLVVVVAFTAYADIVKPIDPLNGG